MPHAAQPRLLAVPGEYNRRVVASWLLTAPRLFPLAATQLHEAASNGCPHMGFEEFPHTADCALRAWAPDLASLFAEAALGLNSIAGAEIGSGARVTRQISLHEPDVESLLVAFLTELVYSQEQEALGFDRFHLHVSNRSLSGTLDGSMLASLSKPIKAVTFHNLEIRESARGKEAEIVFDV